MGQGAGGQLEKEALPRRRGKKKNKKERKFTNSGRSLLTVAPLALCLSRARPPLLYELYISLYSFMTLTSWDPHGGHQEGRGGGGDHLEREAL